MEKITQEELTRIIENVGLKGVIPVSEIPNNQTATNLVHKVVDQTIGRFVEKIKEKRKLEAE